MADGSIGGGEPTRCAALPWQWRDGVPHVLLVTPRGGAGWILPKGKIEAHLGPRESARREAEEEAGVDGEVDAAPFDQYRHGSGGRGPLVTVYLLRVTREMTSWPEAHQRERRWVPLRDARRLVRDPGLRRVLRGAVERVGRMEADAARQPARRSPLAIAAPAVLLAAALGLLAMAALV